MDVIVLVGIWVAIAAIAAVVNRAEAKGAIA